MSHSSGISASQDLITLFGEANQNNIRAIKVVIQNDALVSEKTFSIQGDFESDLDQVSPLLDKASPCYVLFKTDDKSIELRGFNWLFLFYVPDNAKVRDKMTYASTRSNLKKELGNSHFVDEIYSSAVADFSKKGYKQHKTHQSSDAPLTMEEQQRNEERESGLFVGGGGAGMHAHGVSFPVEDRANKAISGFLSKEHNYIQLAINIEDEKIIFCEAKNITATDIPNQISPTEPRFHFFRYSHQHEGENLDSIIFIYSCPDGSAGTKSAPVRMRMLYSSSKSNVESLITRNNVKVDLKLEVNASSEISQSSIDNELHPPKPEEKKAFTKPTRPGAGSRKLINK